MHSQKKAVEFFFIVLGGVILLGLVLCLVFAIVPIFIGSDLSGNAYCLPVHATTPVETGKICLILFCCDKNHTCSRLFSVLSGYIVALLFYEVFISWLSTSQLGRK